VRIGPAGLRGVPVRQRAALAFGERSETASEKILVLAIYVRAKAFSMTPALSAKVAGPCGSSGAPAVPHAGKRHARVCVNTLAASRLTTKVMTAI